MCGRRQQGCTVGALRFSKDDALGAEDRMCSIHPAGRWQWRDDGFNLFFRLRVIRLDRALCSQSRLHRTRPAGRR